MLTQLTNARFIKYLHTNSFDLCSVTGEAAGESGGADEAAHAHLSDPLQQAAPGDSQVGVTPRWSG